MSVARTRARMNGWKTPGLCRNARTHTRRITTPAERIVIPNRRVMPVRRKHTLGLTVVKKRLVKLALTLGTVAAALLSGAANFKIG